MNVVYDGTRVVFSPHRERHKLKALNTTRTYTHINIMGTTALIIHHLLADLRLITVMRLPIPP